MTRDLDVIINPDDFAEEVVYHASEGDSTIYAIYFAKSDKLLSRETGVEISDPNILVKASDVAEVKIGSDFTARGTRYEVISITYEKNDFLKLYLSVNTKRRF